MISRLDNLTESNTTPKVTRASCPPPSGRLDTLKVATASRRGSPPSPSTLTGSAPAVTLASCPPPNGRLDNLVESATFPSPGWQSGALALVSERLITQRPSQHRNTTGDSGDAYTGLDRFGRIIQQLWLETVSGTLTLMDGYGYTYDRDGNVKSKENFARLNTELPAARSDLYETYTYDSLNRLTSYTRNSTSSNYQAFTLDALGNITGLNNGSGTLTRTYNSENQMMTFQSASGYTIALTYDSNGNLTSDDHGDGLIYNAWNQLIQANGTSGSAIATYSYDGTGRRITEANSGTTTDFYFDGQQDIEERQGGSVTVQNVWSPVDGSLMLRDAYTGGSYERLYMTHDADENVTGAVATSTGNVTQRMVYDGYGTVTYKNPDFTSGSNGKNLAYFYQNMRLDSTIGWYFTDTRLYSPTMMRFNRVDPAGYINGPNDYGFELGSPIANQDPSGMSVDENTSGNGFWATDPFNPNGGPVWWPASGPNPLDAQILQLQQNLEGDIAQLHQEIGLLQSYMYALSAEDYSLQGQLTILNCQASDLRLAGIIATAPLAGGATSAALGEAGIAEGTLLNSTVSGGVGLGAAETDFQIVENVDGTRHGLDITQIGTAAAQGVVFGFAVQGLANVVNTLGPGGWSVPVGPGALPIVPPLPGSPSFIGPLSLTQFFPPNDGFFGQPLPVTLSPGALVDRVGLDSGTYVAPYGTPYSSRSLIPGSDVVNPYNLFRVVEPIEGQGGPAAAWFGQPGGGTQYKLPASVESLLKSGQLEKVGS